MYSFMLEFWVNVVLLILLGYSKGLSPRELYYKALRRMPARPAHWIEKQKRQTLSSMCHVLGAVGPSKYIMNHH